MNKILKTIPAVVFSLLIFWLSHQPQPTTPDLGLEWQDKIFHASAYFVYAILLCYALNSYSLLRKTTLSVAAIISIAYSASDEIHQYFIPGRSCEFADFIADVFGIVLGLILMRAFYKKKQQP